MTTNLSYPTWHDFLGNPLLTKALLSRLRERCHTITICIRPQAGEATPVPHSIAGGGPPTSLWNGVDCFLIADAAQHSKRVLSDTYRLRVFCKELGRLAPQRGVLRIRSGEEFMSIKDLAKRMSFSLVSIATISTSQLAIASSDSGTLTPGRFLIRCNPATIVPSFLLTGYDSGLIGSYSPTGLAGGKTVFIVSDESPTGCGANISLLRVTGFTSDPGSSWLTSITCNGVKNLASAGSYSYTSGFATWTWSQKFGLSSGAQVSCTIVHS